MSDELMSLEDIEASYPTELELDKYEEKPWVEINMKRLARLSDTARAAHKLKQRVEELEQSIGVCPDCKEAYSLTEQQATL